MSAAKRKNNPEQPELPVDGIKPAEDGAAKAKPAKNGNGETHVLAEEVAPVVARPFVPGTIELPLHRRVNTIQIKRQGRRWLLVLSCDDVPTNPLPATGPAGRHRCRCCQFRHHQRR